MVASVAALLEDLVLLLQPLRANPARMSVNSIEFFIGGLIYATTDRAHTTRFANHSLVPSRCARKPVNAVLPCGSGDFTRRPRARMSIVLGRNGKKGGGSGPICVCQCLGYVKLTRLRGLSHGNVEDSPT